MSERKKTEQKIFEAATELFLKKGVDRTSVRDIAAKANINLALLNYYFRSKENLFNTIFAKLMQENSKKLIEILDSDMSLKEKIENYVVEYIDMLLENPLLVSFVMSILHRSWDEKPKMDGFNYLYSTEKFTKQLSDESRKGNIKKINPTHFFVDMLSLITFPFAIKLLIMDKAEINEREFRTFIRERKKRIPRLLINELKIKSD